MARPSVAARNYSQTEELERLEQSITLTLQGVCKSRPYWGEIRHGPAADRFLQRLITTLARHTES